MSTRRTREPSRLDLYDPLFLLPAHRLVIFSRFFCLRRSAAGFVVVKPWSFFLKPVYLTCFFFFLVPWLFFWCDPDSCYFFGPLLRVGFARESRDSSLFAPVLVCEHFPLGPGPVVESFLAAFASVGSVFASRFLLVVNLLVRSDFLIRA